MTLVSVQPFGIRSPGGGPRILRALFSDSPIPATSVCTGTHPPPRADGFDELWSPARPRLSPLEGTRLDGLAAVSEWPFRSRLRRRLEAACRDRAAVAVHSVAHTTDFAAAREVSHRLDVPFLLSVHDDVQYALGSRPDRRFAMEALRAAWRDAQHRFVISPQLGDEYCRRYGSRPFSVVTDGLTDEVIADNPHRPVARRFYFAGLFHQSYRTTMTAFVDALEALRDRSGAEVSMTCRCGSLPEMSGGGRVPVTVLPFADERQVQSDLSESDVLYMPMPFDPRHAALVRFSLSTKLITYLGSGRPIVYHGPAEGAAYELLSSTRSAILVSSLDPPAIRRALEDADEAWEEVAGNALALARGRFRLREQRERFWAAVPTARRPAWAVT